MALEESAQRHTQRTGLVWCYFVKGGIGGELGWCGTGPRIGLVENWAGVVLAKGGNRGELGCCGAGPRLGTVEIWASMEAVFQCVADAQLTSAYDAKPQETTDPMQRPSC